VELESFEKRMDNMMHSLCKGSDGMQNLKEAAVKGELNAGMIIDEVIRLTNETALKSVPREQFAVLETEASQLRSTMHDLSVFKDE